VILFYLLFGNSPLRTERAWNCRCNKKSKMSYVGPNVLLHQGKMWHLAL